MWFIEHVCIVPGIQRGRLYIVMMHLFIPNQFLEILFTQEDPTVYVALRSSGLLFNSKVLARLNNGGSWEEV